jgi:hypothetical protein
VLRSDIRNWLVLSPFLTLACAQEAPHAALDWRVRFACEADRAASSTLQLAIRRGTCAVPGALVFSTTLSPGEEVPTPSELRNGAYSFSARALDGSEAVTSGCTDLQLPAADRVETLLEPTQVECSAPELPDAGAPDPELDGGDTGTPDAAPLDAGLDAETHDANGGAALDAAMNAAQEAGLDAAPGCSCASCGAPCGCANGSCFNSRLFIAYSGDANATWRPIPTLTVQASAVVRLGFAATQPSGDKLVAPPEPLLVLMASSFSDAAEIDAFARLSDGRYVFSTREDETFLGESFDDDDLIAFEPLSQSVSRYMDLGSLLSAVSGSDVDVDALHILEDETIYFSVDADVKAGNATFGRADLLRLGKSGIERVVNGAEAWSSRDLESLGLNPVTGHFLASFAGSGGLGSGASIAPTDLVELAFGPDVAFKAGYSLFLRGSSEFSAVAGTLSALHFGE